MSGEIEINTIKHMQLFAGQSSRELARKVADYLDIELGKIDIHQFSNGETYCRYEESVRGADVFILQTHSAPVNDNIMESLVMIDAARRASAKRITVVIPFYGYARQDKKARSREPITARLLADLLTVAGADRVVSMDLHTGQIQGYFSQPLDHLTALPLLSDWIEENLGDTDLVIASPDAGRVRMAEKFVSRLNSPGMAFLAKTRTAHNVAKTLAVVGEVKGKTVVLCDDMIDTAGTLCGAAEALIEQGAVVVYAVATHPVLSGPAIERIEASPIKKVVVTDTLPLPPHAFQTDKIVQLSIAGAIGETLRAIFEDRSISDLFGSEK